MSDDDLLRFLEAEQASSYHYVSSDTAAEREQALRDYYRMPYGNEEDGRSQTISSDVFDVVEGMLPELLETFVSTDKAVSFEPQTAEDEEGAKQAGIACNHVFYKQNNGFLVLHDAIKDGLLLKTGAIRWWWDESREVSFSTYTADEMQIAMYLMANPDAKVIEQDEVETPPEVIQQAQMMGQMPPRRLKVKIRTVAKRQKVRIASIPPDELFVSARHDCLLLDEAPYIAYVSERTVSDIRQMGYDVTADEVRAAKEEEGTEDRDFTNYVRNGGSWNGEDDNPTDESMHRGWLRMEYPMVDFDGDGIAERRCVVRLGKKILENKECSHVPIAAWSPYIIPHKFIGMSAAELVSDSQKIGTDILRAQLDNLALANNQETVVLTDSQGNPLADIDDLLNRRTGGIIRERAPGAVRPYVERWQGVEAFPMVEQLQTIKENRTGYTRYSQGLDGESLNKTATGVTKIMNASQKRMKLMARICAEALVAPTFRGIFKTLTDYCMEKLSIRLSDKYVQIDPQEWRDGYDMTINIGMGQGDEIQQAAMLQQIAGAQMALMQSPLGGRVVTEANVFEAQAAIAENAGFKNPARFWTDPKGLPPPNPPPPDPKMQLEQAKMQADAQEAQAKRADDAMRFKAESQIQMQIDTNRQEQEARQKMLELQQTAELEKMRAQYEDAQQQRELAFKEWFAQFDRDTKLMLANIQSQDKQRADMLGMKKHADSREDAYAMKERDDAK